MLSRSKFCATFSAISAAIFTEKVDGDSGELSVRTSVKLVVS